METPDKTILEYAKDSILGIAIAIAGIVTAWIKTRPKQAATQSSESQAFAKLGVDIANANAASMQQEIVALRARVADLEKRVDEIMKAWGDERVKAGKLASELEDALEDNRTLRDENAVLKGNNRH